MTTPVDKQDLMIETSLVIPTLNRPQDLTNCLRSITNLEQGFDEIIIVEQGTLKTTNEIADTFTELNIQVYFHPIQSAAQARNVGIEKAHGAFIFFLDDDTTLEKNYVKVALAYIKQHPEIVGLTGKMIAPPEKQQHNIIERVKRIIGVLLLGGGEISFYAKVLKSGHAHSVFYPDLIQNVQWLSTAHAIYRNHVFTDGFRFNQNFIRWSAYEDVMMSYQIYKHYGEGSLQYLPDFQLTHHTSDDISITSDAFIRMCIVHHYVFWKQEVYQRSLLNLLLYLLGQIGAVILLLKINKINFRTCQLIIKTYQYLFKNRHKISKHEIDYSTFIING